MTNNAVLTSDLNEIQYYFETKGVSYKPKVGIVLGTGLSKFCSVLKEQSSLVLPYYKVKGLPQSTVRSHPGEFVFSNVLGTDIVVMNGRFHYYEGYSAKEVAYPIRIMKELGVEYLILTCAAGGLDTNLKAGDFVVLNHYIHTIPDSPLRGSDSSIYPRHPNMAKAFDVTLTQFLQEELKGVLVEERPTASSYLGTLVSVPGPELSSDMEYVRYTAMGASVISMSTTPEIIQARQLGIKVAALSVVTDICYGDYASATSIEEIESVAKKGGEALSMTLFRLIRRISSNESHDKVKKRLETTEG